MSVIVHRLYTMLMPLGIRTPVTWGVECKHVLTAYMVKVTGRDVGVSAQILLKSAALR